MTTIKSLQIGDLHIYQTTLGLCREVVDKILLLAKKEEYDFIVILGDILHTNDTVKLGSFDLAYYLINELRVHTPVYVIIGNHDLASPDNYLTTEHFFNPLKEYENVVVVDKVVIEYFQGQEFIFCPYTPPDKFIETLDNADDQTAGGWKDCVCVFSHQDIRGGGYDREGVTSTSGVVWKEDYPFYIGGHHHRCHKPKDNIYLPGSCIATSHSDNYPKSVSSVTFHIDEDNVKLWKIKAIPLGIKEKKTVYIDVNNLNNSDVNTLSENFDLRVCYQGKREELKEFERTECYNNLKSKGVKLCPTEKKIKTNGFESGLTFQEIFTKVIEKKSQCVRDAYKILNDDE